MDALITVKTETNTDDSASNWTADNRFFAFFEFYLYLRFVKNNLYKILVIHNFDMASPVYVRMKEKYVSCIEKRECA